MKILQLCTKVPYPPKDGGATVIYQTARALVYQGHRVEIIAVNPEKHFINPELKPNPETIPIHPVKTNTSVNIVKASINLFFKSLPYHIERFKTIDFQNKLTEVLLNFKPDIVQIEGVYLCEYIQSIRKISNAKIVLRQHNAEHKIWKEIANKTRNPFLKTYLSIQWRRLKKYEINALKKADGVCAITELDLNIFKSLHNNLKIITIPHGIFINGKDSPKPQINIDFFYIGALDWLPNQKAIQWFITGVWPTILKDFPDLVLHVAGRNAPAALCYTLNSTNGIRFYGEIDNQEVFFSEHSVLLVPLFSGSGIRVKIIEAMQHGCLVIASMKAIEGINAEKDIHFLQADSEIEFTEKIKLVINNKAIFEKITKNAREFVNNSYNMDNLAKKLCDFYTRL